MNDTGENACRATQRNMFTRDFILGFFTFFAYMFASFALIPTLPVYLVKLGSREGEIGVLVGIFSVSSLVSRFLAGGALSRYSEKSIMISAALLFAVTFPAFIIFHPFWPVFAVRLFQGVAYACLDTAAFALVVKVTPPAYRGRALSYFMLAPSLATFMAPSLGMAVVNRFSFTALFFFCMAVSLCALLFSVTLKGPETGRTDTDTAARSAFFLKGRLLFLL
jgi:MFS family permease